MKSKIINLFGLSGSGKTTVEQMLKKKEGFHKVTSCCTRNIRDGEIDGQDYYFISEEKFSQLESENKFAEVGGKYGSRYGVLTTEIKNDLINVLVTAKDGILELQHLGIYDMINVWFDCDICERFMRISKRNNLEYALKRIEKDGFRREEEIDKAEYIIDTTSLDSQSVLNNVNSILENNRWI